MLDLKASPYIVTCRGISKGHCSMRKKALYGLGGGASSSLYLAYMDVTLKTKKERADVLFVLVTGIKKKRKERKSQLIIYLIMFEKTN